MPFKRQLIRLGLRLGLALCLGLAGLPGLAQHQGLPPDCAVPVAVKQAERSIWRGNALLDQATVAVTDQLERRWRAEDIRIRYRFTVPACAVAQPQVLWVYRVGAPYRASADGVPLLPIHPFAGIPSQVYNGRVPALFELPQGAQQVQIELATLPYIGSGLVRVEIGTQAALMPMVQLSERALTLFNDYSSAVIAVVGVLALAAWTLRRQDRQILWFGIACVGWALRGLFYQVFEIPWSPLLHEQTNPALVLLTTSAILVSTWYSLGRMTRARAWALGGTLVLMALGFATTLALERGAALVRSAAFLLGLVQFVALSVTLFRHGGLGKQRTWLLLAGYIAALAGAVHDLCMVVGWVNPGNWSFLTPGFSVMLLCYTVAVSQHLVRNLNRAENANQELELAIASKSTQLEASYALLRDSEREAARTQEREHLLREMHDGLGAQLMTAMRGVERGALAREQVLAALQDSLDDLRLLMDSTDLGRQLQGALVAWRNRWDPRLAALDISLQWQVQDPLDDASLKPDAVLQLMRILQEATANVVKHAQASRITLTVTQDHTGLTLTIQDDGLGLEMGEGVAAPRPASRGLRNMQNRAKLLGGSLDINALAAPLHGTQIALHIPARNNA